MQLSDDNSAWTDPEGDGGGRWSGPPPPPQSYQARIQCWTIIGTPANAISMAFRWRADHGPLMVVFGSSLPSSTKQCCQSWTPLTKLPGSANAVLDKIFDCQQTGKAYAIKIVLDQAAPRSSLIVNYSFALLRKSFLI